METYRINPETINGESRFDFPSKRIPFTYLHGKLQNDNGYDIFSIAEPAPTEEGIYPCLVGKVKATFYLWKTSYGDTHGLVVANDDFESIEYAEKCYKEKTDVL